MHSTSRVSPAFFAARDTGTYNKNSNEHNNDDDGRASSSSSSKEETYL